MFRFLFDSAVPPTNNAAEQTLRQYDKVLFNPKNSVPVDFEPGNHLFVVPIDDVVAVFRNRR